MLFKLLKYNNDEVRCGWLLVFLIFILFKPTPTLLLGPAIGMKIPDVIFIVLSVIFLYLYRHHFKSIPLLPIVFLFLMVEILSQFKGTIVNVVLINDLVELIRPIEFILALAVGSTLCEKGSKLYYDKFTILIIILFITFSLLIFFDFMGIKSASTIFYEVGKSRGYSDINTKNIWRLASTFTNPNYFGLFCCAIAGVLLYRLLSFWLMLDALFFVVFTSFVILSGSRTGLVSLICIFIAIFFVDLVSKGIKTKSRIVSYGSIFIFSLIALPKIFDVGQKVLWRFTNVQNMEESFGARIEAWNSALITIQSNFIIGVGSNKSMVKSLDNNYLMILYKNGIVGLLIVSFILLLILNLGFKLYNKSKLEDQYGSAISVLLLSSVLVIIIGMLTAVPLYMSQIFIPFFMLTGYSFTYFRKNYGE